MSRAFVKEQDGAEVDTDLPELVVSPHRKLVTPEGLAHIDRLRRAREAVVEARAAGDRAGIARFGSQVVLFIEDTSVESPIDSATTESLRETTHAVLAGLTPREAKVLRMRFGIDMTTDHTLEEVGKQFDVTRERIRQIEAKALRKLRHPSRSEQLRSFLED